MNSTATVSYLLQLAHCNPNCATNDGRTPLDVARKPAHIRLLLNHGAKPTPCFPKHLQNNPTGMAIKMFVLGNPGAGKSSFVKSLETKGDVFSRIKNRFTKVRNVDEQTAGIIPHDVESEALGRITIFDLAGHKEFYASHDNLLRNSLTNSPAIIILVIDIRGEEGVIRETLQYWFEFISNHISDGGPKLHLLVVGSHADSIPSGEVRLKTRVLQLLVNNCSSDNIVIIGQSSLDCRYAESSPMSRIRSILSQSCQTLRNSEEMTVAHHSFLVFLLDRFKDQPAVTFGTTVKELRCSLNTDDFLYLECVKFCDPLEICDKLNERGNILFMKNHACLENSWIVCDKDILLSQITGVIFAPKGFKDHQEFSTSTGVVPLSKLAFFFPQLNSSMIVQFLCHFEFCQEVVDPETLSVLLMSTCTNIAASPEERFFFFPCFVDLELPHDVWQPNDYLNNHSGWLLQCSQPEQFFSPRFLHVLILRLTFTFVLVPSKSSSFDVQTLPKPCRVWKNGLFWSNRSGIEVIVEVTNQKQIIIVMRCLESQESIAELIFTRSAIIRMVLNTKEELCRKVLVHESFICPRDAIHYPLNILKIKSVRIVEVAQSVAEAKVGVLDESQGMLKLETLLHFEPYANLGEPILQKLFNEDSHTEIEDEFLYRIADCVHKQTDNFIVLFKPSATRLDNIVDLAPQGETHRLVRVFQLWKEEMGAEGTCHNFRKKLDQFSIFAGRNPLDLIFGSNTD